MTNQEDREKKPFPKEAPSQPHLFKESLLVEGKINELDQIVSQFQDQQIDGLGMVSQVLEFWDKANQDPILKPMIEAKMKELRVQLHQVAPLNISEYGDPVKKRYDPREWLGRIPPEFKGKKEEFILDRVGSLRDFFTGLYPKKAKPDRNQA